MEYADQIEHDQELRDGGWDKVEDTIEERDREEADFTGADNEDR